MPDDLLTIGELAARTGVAASALRYYEQLGLVRPARRESGRRRYAPSSVELVGVVLFLQEVGFSLREIRRLISSRSSTRPRRELAAQKLTDLDSQITKARAAREAIEHSLKCPRENILECPNFWVVVRGVLEGKSLSEAHVHTGR